MAKRFIRISLATKFRLLMGAALLAVIAAALVLPWYFMEMLAQQNLQVSADELTHLRLEEFSVQHSDPARRGESSIVADFYANGEDPYGQRKMLLHILEGPGKQQEPLDTSTGRARKAFEKNQQLDVSVIKTTDDEGRSLFRCFRAVRMDASCTKCHDETLGEEFRFAPGQLVAMVDLSMPGPLASGMHVFWTRVAFLAGGVLAAILAFVLFILLSRWLVLRPIRQLSEVADKVADGDLTVRSSIETGDELQHLGESFNEMLE
ncbi:MAG TPA: HAMP domain-containing protein, partial [Phycisphaerae bacterium]|nr:HAMP domain-containing protein [Phycisphaerae bacterium]